MARQREKTMCQNCLTHPADPCTRSRGTLCLCLSCYNAAVHAARCQCVAPIPDVIGLCAACLGGVSGWRKLWSWLGW